VAEVVAATAAEMATAVVQPLLLRPDLCVDVASEFTNVGPGERERVR